MARPSMTVELWPTTSAAANPRSQTTCLQQLAQTGQDLTNDSQVPCIFFLLPTQDQTEEGKYEPQTHSKVCPNSS